MHIFRRCLLAACLLAGSAHAAPVPESKTAYLGHWQGKAMELNLSKDGKVRYKRDQPGKRVDIEVDLLEFNGNNFDVGWGIVRSTFVVSQPPHRVGKQWKMTVDGVELTKDE
ncbi:hypothetical protein [Massilia sp. AB1]|uniref:hypothetical protein n=1 Tax=Massilia sp. AB1 TaxID=2823371 RepID=UPI001B84507A|nr:hypothetical protein [Massilia sp. AB1]MBQ5941765.1 hypothetical protein [Massilia sp. AB1]